MKKITYLAAVIFAVTFSWQSTAQYLSEDFTGQTIPTGWTNVDNGTTGSVWQFNNPGSRVIPAPFVTDFAILDSDNYQTAANAVLVTAAFDVSGALGSIILNFDQQYRDCCGSSITVEVFNGSTWTEVYTEGGNGGTITNSQSIDITTVAGGSTVAQVRFTYLTPGSAWRWAIDNIEVVDACLPPTNLVVSDINQTDVDLSWDAAMPAPGDGYYWEIQPQGFPQGDIERINFGTTAAGITTVNNASGIFHDGQSYVLYVNSVCATGSDESTFVSVEFTVLYNGSCGMFSNTPNTAIPDNDPIGITDVMTGTAIPGEVLVDLNVYIGVTHASIGDLTITLTSPSGISVEIFNGCSDQDNIDVEFDDLAGVGITCGVPGSYTPVSPLSAFNGESFNGDWTLFVSDDTGSNLGVLNQWCLIPTFGTAAGTGSCTSGDTKTWNGIAWSNDNNPLDTTAPDGTDAAIFAGTYSMLVSSLPSVDACRIWVNTGVPVDISSGNYMQTNGSNEINGTLVVLAGGSFVNLDGTASTINNNTIITRTATTPVGINGFSLLGSPMTMETREAVYATLNNNQGSAHIVREHDTSKFIPNIYVEQEDGGIDNWADDNGDNWVTKTGALTPGVGYLVTSYNPSVDLPIIADYKLGTFNNGDITVSTRFNTDQIDSPNILANPYPSAISTIALISEFANADLGAVYFWDHITNPTGTTYPGYSGDNYDMGDISMHNGTGGVKANNNPSGVGIPTDFIASGQGFGVKPITGGSNTVTFLNSMRVTGNNDDLRVQTEVIERLRLAVTNTAFNLNSSTLIGFTNLATDDFDPKYDALRLATPISLYSYSNEKELTIQGRSAFNVDQVVPLGFRTMVQEEQTYTISISDVEGDEISNANVFLQDNLLHITTNLSETDYTFTSNESNQKDRFVIVFAEGVLGTSDANLSAISVYPNPTKNILNIVSPLSKVTNVVIYDIAGRTVATYDFSNNAATTLDMSSFNSAVYFVKINTEDGSIVKRVIRE